MAASPTGALSTKEEKTMPNVWLGTRVPSSNLGHSLIQPRNTCKAKHKAIVLRTEGERVS